MQYYESNIIIDPTFTKNIKLRALFFGKLIFFYHHYFRIKSEI